MQELLGFTPAAGQGRPAQRQTLGKPAFPLQSLRKVTGDSKGKTIKKVFSSQIPDESYMKNTYRSFLARICG